MLRREPKSTPSRPLNPSIHPSRRRSATAARPLQRYAYLALSPLTIAEIHLNLAYCLALWLAHFFGPDGAAGCIEPVYNLLRKLQGDRCRHVLTAIHPILLLASLRANNYHVAMHMLQNYPVMEVDTKVGFFFKSQQQKFTIAKIPGFHAHLQLFSVAYHDNLKYHLFAGTVAAIVGNYAMAIELLEAVGAAFFLRQDLADWLLCLQQAVSAPAHANTGSLIQIDAYKRLVLVQLIQNGKVE